MARLPLILALALLLPTPALASEVVILTNPYAGINWGTIDQHLGNTHDHTYRESTGVEDTLDDYLDAGYTIVPHQNYSGEPNPSYAAAGPYCAPASFWCVAHDWNAELGATIKAKAVTNKALFVTQIESRAGGNHFTVTPFDSFVTQITPAPSPDPDMAASPDPECLTTANCASAYDQLSALDSDRFVIGVAHPTNPMDGGLRAFAAYLEIYSNFYDNSFNCDGAGTNRNDTDFRQAWDHELVTQGNTIWGVAVNDHFAPGKLDSCATDVWVDTGKTLFLLEADVGVVTPTEDQYRSALRNGNMIAVKDVGGSAASFRYDYPTVSDFSVSGTDVTITHDDATADIVWIIDGLVEHRTAANSATDTLDLTTLPVGTRYVRAEVRADDGDTIYMQPLIVEATPDPVVFWFHLTAVQSGGNDARLG